jgi:alpha-galactosidase
MLSALLLTYLANPHSLHQQGTPFELQNLDVSGITVGYGEPHKNLSIDSHPLTIQGKVYDKGIGVHAISEAEIRLGGNGITFSSVVGLDDETQGRGSIRFIVYGDGKQLAKTPVLNSQHPMETLTVDVRGVKVLKLVVDDAGDGIDYDHADWANPVVTLADPTILPKIAVADMGPTYPIAPVDLVHTRINGASVVGCTPGYPFSFRVPVSGEAPIDIKVSGLPKGLAFSPSTHVISGAAPSAGTYRVHISASGPKGADHRVLTIVAGTHKLALTPPMGWNSWNVWAGEVNQARVQAAADAFVRTGLADFGYQYINIDDTWEGKRDQDGLIQTNEKFPDMEALATYVHSKGLKIGIYSSPGPETCAGFAASYKHELDDAKTYAKWGMDYLKYDWCSYGGIDPHPDLAGYKKPYIVMRDALDQSGRDIVFSLCQYGMGDVYKWGKDIGGNLWRTTGDINDSWSSMSGIGFSHSIRSPYVKPGGWNDPDMLVVGRVGWGSPHPSHLKPNEQITHIGLWALLAAPLIIGCDLERIDDFTQQLLMNPEVIDIDQDPLGKAAVRVRQDGDLEVWARPLWDGSVAVGLFNRGLDAADVTVDAKDLQKLHRHAKIRDVWKREDVGPFNGSYKQSVPAHGGVLLRIG